MARRLHKSKIKRFKSYLIYFKYIFLILFGLFISYQILKFIFKPNLSQYPKLNSCFITSIYKINLCPSNPHYVGIRDVSPYLMHSILISEDDSFYFHNGIDWKEFKKSFIQNLKLKRFARGGSTITQQLVKNIYLSHTKSILRKFKEILLAQQVEKNYSKSVILEKYLNVIELGTNLYGVKDAAWRYFQKSPSKLNVLESLYLTILLPNPRVYSASFDKKRLSDWQKERIELLLKRLLQRKRISAELYELAHNKINEFPWKGLSLNYNKSEDTDDYEFLNDFDKAPEDPDFGPPINQNTYDNTETSDKNSETNLNTNSLSETQTDETTYDKNDFIESDSNPESTNPENQMPDPPNSEENPTENTSNIDQAI